MQATPAFLVITASGGAVDVMVIPAAPCREVPALSVGTTTVNKVSPAMVELFLQRSKFTVIVPLKITVPFCIAESMILSGNGDSIDAV